MVDVVVALGITDSGLLELVVLAHEVVKPSTTDSGQLQQIFKGYKLIGPRITDSSLPKLEKLIHEAISSGATDSGQSELVQLVVGVLTVQSHEAVVGASTGFSRSRQLIAIAAEPKVVVDSTQVNSANEHFIA